ncbi:MAG TPA: GNAT family N-acetyltransferase [Flavobacteriales bacterium]|nr:GNAT family N-acetyltransferase [Flavobacteriales bacterium]
MTDHAIRPATTADVDFLAEAIIAAEKSNSPRLGLATLFGLTEEEVRALIIAMLREEVDGCEYSISSFLVVEHEGRAVAAVAGWLEGSEDDMPSGLLKSNLIGFTFPPESIALLRTRAEVISGIQIDREMGSVQIEYVYAHPDERGKGLAAKLIAAHFARFPRVRKAQVQAFSDNPVAIGLYQRLGFRIVHTFTSKNPDTIRFMPFHEKVLMERVIDN